MGGCVFANVVFGLYDILEPVLLPLVVLVEAAVLWALDRSREPTVALFASGWCNTVSTLAGFAIATVVSGVSVPLGFVAGYVLTVVIEVIAIWPFWNAPRTRAVFPIAMANLVSYSLLAAILAFGQG
jgi:uncharacterized membrane protein